MFSNDEPSKETRSMLRMTGGLTAGILLILLGAWFSHFWISLQPLLFALPAIGIVLSMKWALDARRIARLRRAIDKMPE